MDSDAPAKTRRSTRVQDMKKKNALAELTNALGRKRGEDASTKSGTKTTKQILIDNGASTSTTSICIRKGKAKSKKSPKNQRNYEISINYDNMNNNTDCLNELTQRCELLKAIYNSMDTHPTEGKVYLRVGYTHDDLKNFLENSTLKEIFPAIFGSNDASNAQLLKQLSGIVYDLGELQLDQILDLYHLAFLMQQYQQLDTHCQDLRFELLQAVAELAVMLQREQAEYIGITLCDRLVYGADTERIIVMHGTLVQLINYSDRNRDIAMAMLIAIIGKVGSIGLGVIETDLITHAFEMLKRVNWMELVVSGREHEMFVLLRSFSLIMNSKHNRLFHPNWRKELGCQIHKYFMQVLRTVRSSNKYNNFTMMVERYIAFCLVSSAAAKFEGTEVFHI